MATAQQAGVVDGRRVRVRHQHEVLQQINRQREEDRYTDFTVVAKGKEFRVHRNVLAACSPYFDTLFQTNMMEQQSGTATLHFTSAEVLEELLAYMYSGTLHVQKDMVEEFLETANHLLMNEVTELCIQYLLEQLDVSNCLAMKALAQLYKADRLLKAANAAVQKNIHALIKREESLDIPLHVVQDLLMDDMLEVSKEEELFDFLVSWTKRDLPEREPHFPSLLSLIRVADIPKSYVEDFVKTEQLVTESAECQKYITKLETSAETESTGLLGARSGKLEEAVLVTGGALVPQPRGTNEEASMEMMCYLPRQDRWYEICPLNYAVSHHAIAVVNGKVFVAGGRLWPGNRITSFVSCYSIADNSWTRVRNMSTKRTNFALVPCKGYLYAIGGKSERIFLGGAIGEVPITTVERYNEETHAWSYATSLSKVCSDVEAVATNDQIYLTNGKDKNGVNVASEGLLPYFSVKTNAWSKLTVPSPVTMQRWADNERQGLVSFLRDNKIHFLGIDSQSAGNSSLSYNTIYQYYDIKEGQWMLVLNFAPDIILPWKSLTYMPVHDGSIFLCSSQVRTIEVEVEDKATTEDDATSEDSSTSEDNDTTESETKRTRTEIQAYYDGCMLNWKSHSTCYNMVKTRRGASASPTLYSVACHLEIPQKFISAFAKDVTENS